MAHPSEVIDKAIGEVDSLRKLLRKKTTRQVRAEDERSIIKASALAWFNNHRTDLSHLSELQSYTDANKLYSDLLASSDRATDRKKYDVALKALRGTLSQLRTAGVATPVQRATTTDEPPTFSPLVVDAEMQQVLSERWRECVSCLGAAAPLAATVMMGGLVEGLLLARINRETDLAPIFRAKTAPREKQGKTKPLREWTLKNYIDVVHELGWISESAKDTGEVLRDYRNYIHPSKQVMRGTHLKIEDAQMFWEISKAISRQVIRSADSTR